VTVLRNTIYIEAPPERAWAALARLDALHEFARGLKRYVEARDAA
jgi:hypothetical protein